MSTLVQASRPLARARSQSNTMRPFSIAIPARLANEWMHMPKPRGFLAEYVLSSFLLTLFPFFWLTSGVTSLTPTRYASAWNGMWNYGVNQRLTECLQ